MEKKKSYCKRLNSSQALIYAYILVMYVVHAIIKKIWILFKWVRYFKIGNLKTKFQNNPIFK